MTAARVDRTLLLLLLISLAAPFAFAQQTGSISGKVTAVDGAALPGVTVEARSNVLPQARVTITNEVGDYRLPALQPGAYTLSYSLAGLQTQTRRVQVQLNLNTSVDVALGMAGVSESITVTAEATLVDTESAEIQTGVDNDMIQALPIAQEYRDLQKLIPGVQVSQEEVRGPSAGGSGQDNVYNFDGVNVTMPLFGVQVAEPATHDIAQFTVLKGGAKAMDFERAAGFSVDSVSKSGTNEYSGQLSYQLRNAAWVADQDAATNSQFDQDREWTTVNFGGPVLRDRLFFYGSYYRPIYTRDNQANLYGDLPKYKSERDEYFAKLTATPTASWLLNGSYRNSERSEIGDRFDSNQAATTALGYATKLEITTLDASWVINPRAFVEAKFTKFDNPGGGRPSNFASVVPSFTPGTRLDINNLDQLGLFTVPTAIASNPAQSAFVQPFIERYGYIGTGGVRTGGGRVGFSSLSADDDDFYRTSGQIGLNYTLGSDITHDLHFGYQQYLDEEDRFQTSNGWGSITIPGGTTTCSAANCGTARPIFFQALLSQQTTGQVPTIHSEVESQSIEINDTIRMNNWTFNIGVLASNDVFYGQGLAKADNIAGFVTSPGTKYKMYEIGFDEMIQPRASATWAYNGNDTVFASYARYNPAVSSLARAASWDRNLVASINVFFDETGTFMGIEPLRSSSGKLFAEGLSPRYTDEFMIGSGQEITPALSLRAYGRYRYSSNFWEDTNNNARIRFGQGVEGVEQELYIPNLGSTSPCEGLRCAIGSGSSYVIAELDGAFTKYYEATLESDWRVTDKTMLRGSYTWSHYYGTFDQDNTSFNTANDAAIFVGSSNLADGAGRQIWNNKYGDLRGDRRHVLKVYGTHQLPWNATMGAFAVYQAGQPYQLESYLPYRPLTGTNTSDTNRYAEPAGRRKSPAHHQLDFNYTQNFGLPRGLNFQLVLDVFNLYDKQTGYNYETRVGTLGTLARDSGGQCQGFETGLDGDLGCLRDAPFAKSFYDPRTFQIAARLQF